MKLTAHTDWNCTIEFEDQNGSDRTYHLNAPVDGGYVTYRKSDNTFDQICSGFRTSGVTMLWRKGNRFPTLADFIRDQYRKMITAQRAA